MNRYLSGAGRVISLFAGICMGGATGLLLALCRQSAPWGWALVVGGVGAMLVAFLLIGGARRREAAFGEAAERVGGAILWRGVTLLFCGRMRRTAFVFLTEDRIHFYLWDHHPYLETTAARGDVTVEEAQESLSLAIRFPDEDVIVIRTPEAEALAGEMRRVGYRVTVHGGRV